MATTSGQLKEQINAYFSSLTLKQKMMLLGGIASGLAVLIFLLIWTAKPNYEVLFSNLSPKDAGKIVESLKEKKIPYQIGNGGSTILVPSGKVYDLRLTFAQEGMPASSNVGYEIFDQSNLGMTDFIQQINYRRALEGELSRTIEQIEAVEQARVHIVIPREALFREDQKSASASVILRLVVEFSRKTRIPTI
ncbi:flagellar M-ring protein FliF [candidate division KSB1 bacterium 4484_188]|nr:MAG: flagellar M-ring protein FliF [candidate division KSB1 bacterium 4484_188]